MSENANPETGDVAAPAQAQGSQPPSSPAKASKKDSTIDLPMYDLSEAIQFVTKIRDEALEAAPMPKVAAGMGYSHPTSTPFYRRMSAARLFGLLTASRAELTPRANGYLKPQEEDQKNKSLIDAIWGVPLYATELERYAGKKLNVVYVANSFSDQLNLTDTCANACARAFEASIRFAGCLTLDGIVCKQNLSPIPPKAENQEPEDEDSDGGLSKTHTLPLDKLGKRLLKVTAPLDITKKEIGRIKKWLEVTLNIEWDADESNAP